MYVFSFPDFFVMFWAIAFKIHIEVLYIKSSKINTFNEFLSLPFLYLENMSIIPKTVFQTFSRMHATFELKTVMKVYYECYRTSLSFNRFSEFLDELLLFFYLEILSVNSFQDFRSSRFWGIVFKIGIPFYIKELQIKFEFQYVRLIFGGVIAPFLLRKIGQ